MSADRFEYAAVEPTVLLLPDFDFGPGDYWQDQWAQQRLDCQKVDLGHARVLRRNALVSRIDRHVRTVAGPVFLVSHGIGALGLAAWSSLMSIESEAAIVGALLVAPNDPAIVEDERLADFLPLPQSVFPFPALVVASDADPHLTADRGFSLARQWGCGFALMPGCGHFRPIDGIGRWSQGEELLDRFLGLIGPGASHDPYPAAYLERICAPPPWLDRRSAIRP
jgi:predicted alpha/beta hydrolase family esterase